MTEVDKNLELIEKYINGFMWSHDTPEITKTIVAANIRAFYHWGLENLVNDRGDRLEAMVDRMAETIVDLRMALATVKEVYEEEGWTHYTTEDSESEINPTYSVIVEALQQESGLTQRALDVPKAFRCTCGSTTGSHTNDCELFTSARQ